MRDRLFTIMEDNGVEYEDNVLVTEIDSIQYMSLMVEIEEEFEIEFPDMFLGENIFENFDRLCEIVFGLVGEVA